MTARRVIELAGVCCTLLLPRPAAARQESIVWRHTFTDTIKSFAVTPSGSIAVLTRGGITVLDGQSGQPLWTRPGITTYRLFDTLSVMLYAAGVGEVANLANGETQWRLDQLPLTRVTYERRLPGTDALLVVGLLDAGPIMLLASLRTGALVWRQDFLFGAKVPKGWGGGLLQRPIWDSDSTFIVVPTGGRVARIHALSGAILWRYEGEPRAGSPGEGFADVLVGGGRVFVPYEKRLFALDAATGRVLWDRTTDFPGMLVYSELTPRGLLVQGDRYRLETGFWRNPGPFLDLVDVESGASEWQEPVRKLTPSTPIVVWGDATYVVSRGQLYQVALTTGALHAVATVPFSKETPSDIWLLDRGILLTGKQNFMLIDTSGVPRYHLYRPAPNAASTYYVLWSSRARVVADSLDPEGDDAEPSPDALDTFTFGEAYMFSTALDASDRNALSIVRLDLRSGKELARSRIEERELNGFLVDDKRAMVYVMNRKREIVARRLGSLTR